MTSGVGSLLMLALGIGLAAVAVQGAIRGWLPSGPNGFRRGTGVSRTERPVLFWILFAAYIGAGLYAALYASRGLVK